VVLKGAVKDLLTLFFILQITMEHQNIGLKLPANVEMFLEQGTSLIEFDVLKPDVLLPLFGVNKTVEEIIGIGSEKVHDGKTVI
jgi:hypothetical protein